MRNLNFITLGTTLLCWDADSDSIHLLKYINNEGYDWEELPPVPPAEPPVAIPPPLEIGLPPVAPIETTVTQSNYTVEVNETVSSTPSRKKRKSVDYSEDFDEWWGCYKANCSLRKDKPKCGNKLPAYKAWQKLSDEDKASAAGLLEMCFNQLDIMPEGARFLRNHHWEELTSAPPPAPEPTLAEDPNDPIVVARNLVDAQGWEMIAAKLNITGVHTASDVVGFLVSNPNILEELK